MDIKQIKCLIDLMVENDLSRIELREGETHILLRRGQPVSVTAAPPAPPVAAPVAPPAPVTASAEASVTETVGAAIRSPMVGTYYAASDPESPPFVKVGDMVGPDTVVCLIEAMKVFNEIKAETSGRVSQVLVKNAEAVEFDQPLFAMAAS